MTRKNYITPRGLEYVQKACTILETVESKLDLVSIVALREEYINEESTTPIERESVDVVHIVYDYVFHVVKDAIQEGFPTVDITKYYDAFGNYSDTYYIEIDTFFPAIVEQEKETRFELYSQNKYVAFFFDDTGLADLFTNDTENER